MGDTQNWLDDVVWNEEGLVPVVTQDAADGRVLMLAYMNREALEKTAESGEAIYWSRSRRRLWHKGESSGHVQRVREIRLDCDGDALLLTVEQEGGIACHTGRHSCFFNRMASNADSGRSWTVVDAVVKDPKEIYK